MPFTRRPTESAEDREAARQARIAAQRPHSLARGGVMGGAVQALPAAHKPPRELGRKRQSIRDSARGEACTVRLPGVCTHDPDRTIWSHCRMPDAGKGGALKSLDVAGAYACTDCDAVYDGQRKPPSGYTRDQVDADWCAGHFRSLVRLHEKGLL